MAGSEPAARRTRRTGQQAPASLGRAEDEVLTTAQVAQFLHVTPQTVIRFVREGILTAHRLPGTRQFLFWRHEIVDLVNANVFKPAETEADADKPVTAGE